MAMTAAQVRIIVHQGAMHGRYIAHLFSNVGVTVCATICHRRRFPGRDVTSFAFAARIRMRSNSS
jgi:hypothetical protein